jgi:hypothetical protein
MATDRDIARLQEARAQLAAAEAAPPPRMPVPAELPPPIMRRSRPLGSTVWGGLVSGAKTIAKVAFVAVVGIVAVGVAGGLLTTFFPATFTPVFGAIEGFAGGYLAPALNYAGVFLTDTLPAVLSSVGTTVQGWFAGAGSVFSGTTASISVPGAAVASAGTAATVLTVKALSAKQAAALPVITSDATAAASFDPAMLDVPDELLLSSNQAAANKLTAQHHGHHAAAHHTEAALLKKTAAHIGTDHAVEHLEKRAHAAHAKKEAASFVDRVPQRGNANQSWAEYAETSRPTGPLTRT